MCRCDGNFSTLCHSPRNSVKKQQLPRAVCLSVVPPELKESVQSEMPQWFRVQFRLWACRTSVERPTGPEEWVCPTHLPSLIFALNSNFFFQKFLSQTAASRILELLPQCLVVWRIKIAHVSTLTYNLVCTQQCSLPHYLQECTQPA